MEPYQNSLNLHTISTLEFQYKSTFLSLSSFEKKRKVRKIRFKLDETSKILPISSLLYPRLRRNNKIK